MKQLIVIVSIILTFVVFFLPVHVQAQETELPPEQAELNLADDVPMDELSGYWYEMTGEYGEFLPDISKVSFSDFLNREDNMSLSSWIQGILRYAGYEIIWNGKLLGTLIILAICSSLLQSIQTAFESKTISKIANMVIMLVLLGLALQSFHLTSTLVVDTIEQMRNFMIALLPLMLGLMSTIGGFLSVSFFQPFIVTFMHFTVILISAVIIPLFFLSALLQMVSVLNETFQVTKLAKLLKSTALSLLAICVTVFVTVLSIHGATSAIQDGVALKATQFIAGNFIPVVGRMFTDATDTIFSASLVLKNAIGVVGLTIILIILLFPAIKVLIIALVYKLTAAIIQPLGNGPIVKCIEIISQHIMYLFAALIAVSIMFFLTIALLALASNVTLMVR